MSTEHFRMVVGVMQIELAIDWAQSLKDKRRVVKSLRDTLHRHHMVSVSEVADQDIWNRASIGIAIVGSSGSAIGATLDRVLERIRATPECELASVSREVLHGWGGSFGHLADNDGLPDDGELEKTLRARANEALERDIA
ncbi:MAG: DUF503 domain-containing protein [Phycisphaerales bacterium JB052]